MHSTNIILNRVFLYALRFGFAVTVEGREKKMIVVLSVICPHVRVCVYACLHLNDAVAIIHGKFTYEPHQKCMP